MFNRVLIIMFAVLFVSQTIAATFDSHSAHQATDVSQNLSHRSLDESHKSHPEGALTAVNQQVKSDSNSTDQNQFDCHHCCHCHAPSGVYIASNVESSLLHKGNDDILAGKTALLSLWISPEHRPPIA